MSTKRILYLDDEKDLLDLAATFFEEESLPIEICSDYSEALNLIKKNRYDLIISDAKLPTGSGHELCRLIRSERLFDGKIILVTGNIENFGNSPHPEYDMVIYKPIKFQELIESVKTLLKVQF